MSKSKKGRKKSSKKRSKKKTKKKDIKFYRLMSRYIILLAFGIGISLFYEVFTPLTIYPVYAILSIFYDAFLYETLIIINGYGIEIVGACIAGSAYFLLLALNLAIPMKPKTRANSILFLFGSLLIINILRIVIFGTLFVGEFTLYDELHLLVWYFMSGIIIFILWVANIKIFNIKEIPGYTDMKLLWKQVKK